MRSSIARCPQPWKSCRWMPRLKMSSWAMGGRWNQFTNCCWRRKRETGRPSGALWQAAPAGGRRGRTLLAGHGLGSCSDHRRLPRAAVTSPLRTVQAPAFDSQLLRSEVIHGHRILKQRVVAGHNRDSVSVTKYRCRSASVSYPMVVPSGMCTSRSMIARRILQ